MTKQNCKSKKPYASAYHRQNNGEQAGTELLEVLVAWTYSQNMHKSVQKLLK